MRFMVGWLGGLVVWMVWMVGWGLRAGYFRFAEGSDLFICEGMYGEKDKIAKAMEHRHMTFCEAAELAKKAQVKEMWLTHFSPSLIRADEFMGDVREIFPNSFPGKDGKTTVLRFEE